MPFVLSLLIIEHKNANDENIKDMSTALIIIDNPAVLNEKINKGIPTDINKAINNEIFNP
jgi:hypothetical protein